MQTPDFASCEPVLFSKKDLLFLFEHFPVPGVDAVEAVRRVMEKPSTLESILESEYVYQCLLDDDQKWLDVSPRLFFDVVLRRTLPGPRDPLDRSAIHYIAQVLALFSRTDRLYRVQPGDADRFQYLFDLCEQVAATDSERRFLVYSHIGNYALFHTGMSEAWIRQRRRAFSLDDYQRLGRASYAQAARYPAAERFGLRPIFGRLAMRFDRYREGLTRLHTHCRRTADHRLLARVSRAG
jgi:hypothetical protein